MEDLVTWLRQQLDEDERVAREADGPRWQPGDGDISEGGLYALDGDNGKDGWAIAWFELGETNPDRRLPRYSNWKRHAHENSVHAARHDPARVLREVVAKREILEWHDAAWKNKRFHPDDLAGKGWLLAMVKVVKLLALPYADRPGYQEEWKP